MDCLTRNPGVQVATFEPQVEPDPEPEVETEVEPPNVNIEAEWNEVTRQLPSENRLRFEEFALVDEGVAVTGTMTDDDILDSLTNDEDAPSDEDHEEEEPADVTSKEARATVRTPSMFLEKTRDVPDSVFSSIVSFENMIDKRVANSFKQKKITDFFNY
ncbi:hypothetical protein WA026_012433 [Henosepilachna vigintioctopunctata]|uniref:Uncharacterized protein n=1 Tax=Henosepilachna vigintioctopunctata TaxID=420089 RepID=A0AAW1UQ56_9CUCU